MELKPKLFKIYKQAGETPLQTITKIRAKFPDFSAEKMTYAGRLDPLAEGVLLVLVGEECKNKEKYLGWDKEYEVEFLLGVKTDTGDVMGIVENALPCHSCESRNLRECAKDSCLHRNDNDLVVEEIKSAINSLLGKKTQAYPKYSSPRLCGKGEIFKTVEIKEAEFLNLNQIDSSVLLSAVTEKISRVVGDFRQKEIMDQWQKKIKSEQIFNLIKCRILCTSGTYIRVLAEELGKNLGTIACVYSLKRTKIGEITEKDCLSLHCEKPKNMI